MLAPIRQTATRTLSSNARLLTTSTFRASSDSNIAAASGLFKTTPPEKPTKRSGPRTSTGSGSNRTPAPPPTANAPASTPPAPTLSRALQPKGPTLATIDPSLITPPPAQDPLLHYLTSRLTTHGHRARAAALTSSILLHIHTLTRAPPLPILRAAVLQASPAVRTLMHRRGGKTVAKPVALGEKQRAKYALGWILDASAKRGGRSVAERVAREVVEIVEGRSAALGEKEKVHKFAMVNRGNAQTRI
ncbi:hypothetical protein AX16_007102 [Volvariella volvacea WC 439]|nr:hypothetical protein AX16_007102 [Volvariella volvacea WC 439]